MASLRDTVKTYLEGNAPLMALLTGGIMDANELPVDGGGTGSLPYDTDGLTIKPFVVVRYRTTTPTEIISSSERKIVEFYVYANMGYTVIDPVIRLLKDLLQRHRFTNVDGAGVVMSHWLQDRDELPADEFGGIPSAMTRFYIDVERK